MPKSRSQSREVPKIYQDNFKFKFPCYDIISGL